MYKIFFYFYKYFFKILINQSLFKRRIILVILDSILIFISFIFSLFLINFDAQNDLINNNIYVFISLIIIEIIIYAFTNQYNSLARYSGTETLYSIGVRNIFTTLLVLA